MKGSPLRVKACKPGRMRFAVEGAVCADGRMKVSPEKVKVA